MPERQARVLIASSESPDFFYATSFFVPDPCLFFQLGRKKTLVLSDLEYGRALSEARVDEVLSLRVVREAMEREGKAPKSLSDVAAFLLRRRQVTRLIVPQDFPFRYAHELQERGFRLQWLADPFYKSRLCKTPEEIRKIKETASATSHAMKFAKEVVAASIPRGGALYYQGQRLTSERLRHLIHAELDARGFEASHTIVAGGKQSSDPHRIGAGVIPPDAPLILDIFPRSSRHHYFADMTRTVVKGKASPRLRRMADAVREAQERAMAKIRHGARVKDVHQVVLDVFDRRGFGTASGNGIPQGFIHATGHGVGLAVHEPPRLAAGGGALKEGMVVTVEPGLYYRDVGGVRFEDTVWVRGDGAEILTKGDRRLELP